LLPLRRSYSTRQEVWEAAVRLSDAQTQPVQMLAEAERILKTNPDNKFALRMRFFALRKVGAVHRALKLTPDSILDPVEQLVAKREQLAVELRWARVGADNFEQTGRWQKMDAVIADLQKRCRINETDGSEPLSVQGMCLDLVVALSDRQRMTEAISLYEKILDKKWAIPPYVHLYAAAGYLHERQPEKARDIYAATLPQYPKSQDGKIGYVYSLLECEQYDEAYSQADKMSAETTEWLNPQAPEIRQPNPAYIRAQILSALIRSYTDRFAEGQARLELLAQRAPHNTEIRQALAMTYGMRGWHHRAEEDVDWLSAADPSNVNIKLRLFENRKAMGDYRSAEQSLMAAVRSMPEEQAVQKAQHEWGTHNLHELRVDARYGQSAGGVASAAPNGTRESVIDARLYSAPYDYDWRYFAHSQRASAAFPGINVSKTTAGGGAEYRVRDLTLTAEVLNIGHLGTGLTVGGDYRMGDHWSINGLAESNSSSVPVRAYVDHVAARNYQLGAAYRWHESRTLNMVASQMGFSDGNQRRAMDVSWTERLLAGPAYKLDTSLEYYASRNSSQSTLINYFNPAADGFVGVSLRGEWVQFHQYEKSFKHVLNIGAGNYSQRNFASGEVSTLHYEQILQTGDHLELRYGLGRTAHPYDGQRVTANFVNLSANWMF
jgi:biofilm PGA synthesis protein PgaA